MHMEGFSAGHLQSPLRGMTCRWAFEDVGGVHGAGEGKTQSGVLVHCGFGACRVHQVLLKPGWNNPWALSSYIFFCIYQVISTYEFSFQEPEKGRSGGSMPNSCNYFLSCILCLTLQLIPSIAGDLFLPPFHRGWLCGLFWPVQCVRSDAWAAVSRGLAYSFLSLWTLRSHHGNTPRPICSAMRNFYCFGWLPGNTARAWDHLGSATQWLATSWPQVPAWAQEIGWAWPRSAEMPPTLDVWTKCLLF